MIQFLLFADENGVPLPPSDDVECYACNGFFDRDDMRRGEDGELYCGWCYDSTGQDPGAFK